MLISRWKAPATPVGEVSWEGGVLGGKVWPLEEMALRGVKLGDWEGVRSWVPKAQLIILAYAVLLFHSLSLVVPICGFLSLTFIFTSWPWFLLCASSSMAHSVDLAHERDSGALALYRSLQKTDTSADWKCCQALKKSASGHRTPWRSCQHTPLQWFLSELQKEMQGNQAFSLTGLWMLSPP